MYDSGLKVIRKLKKSGYQAVFAGGSVRDMLLGNTPKDYDIATDATPDEVESLFKKTFAVGKSFGVIVVIMDDHQFEVATFRKDGDYIDGRRPSSVQFANMKEDAERRDLTINGMFYDPIDDKIYDFIGGQDDLRKKTIRLIGYPYNRIMEDHLRLMRVVRFTAKYNFECDPLTYQMVVDHGFRIKKISAERIRDELLKILRVRNKSKGMNLLYDTLLLHHILPEMMIFKKTKQPPQFHPEGNVWNHTLLALDALPEDASDELLIATLLHDIGKPKTMTIEDRIRFNGHAKVGADMAEVIMKRLKFSNSFIEHVKSMIANHMKFMDVKRMKRSTLKRFMRLDKFREHIALNRADCLGGSGDTECNDLVNQVFEEFIQNRANTSEYKPFVQGRDLINLGMRPNKEFRTILKDVEDMQLDGEVNSKEEAVEYIRTRYIN